MPWARRRRHRFTAGRQSSLCGVSEGHRLSLGRPRTPVSRSCLSAFLIIATILVPSNQHSPNAQVPPPPSTGTVGGAVGVGVGGGSGGVRTGAGISIGTGGLIDPIGRSVLMGAALGGLGGPIGLGAGALVGLILGISQRERMKREAEEVMKRQKEIDKAQEQEIEALQRDLGSRQTAGARGLTLDAKGLVVLEDHLANEPAPVANWDSNRGSITGLIVLEDHLAPDIRQTATPAPGVLSAKTQGSSIRTDIDNEIDRLSQEVERREARVGGDARVKGQEASQPTGSETRRKQLEMEIEAELLKQKELLAKMRRTVEPEATQAATLPSQSAGVPPAPGANLPSGEMTTNAKVDPGEFVPIFESGRLVRRERDLKGVGRPDTILYYDAGGQLVRKEESTHFDGRIDACSYFDHERLARKEADTNGDGRVDFWAFYNEREDLVRTESDTSFTGRRDLIQEYENGSVVREERFGPTGDRPRVVLVYDKGSVVRKEEDTTGAGRMDVVSFFDGRGRLTKQVRDPGGQGVPAETTFYDPATGDLVRKEEDLRGSGKVDSISYYDGGRLVRREIFDLEDVRIQRIAVLSAEGERRETAEAREGEMDAGGAVGTPVGRGTP